MPLAASVIRAVKAYREDPLAVGTVELMADLEAEASGEPPEASLVECPRCLEQVPLLVSDPDAPSVRTCPRCRYTED